MHAGGDRAAGDVAARAPAGALPNLLIVGAQKCGTTWLHRALARSSAIGAGTAKELNFFNGPDPAARLDWYAAQFAGAARSPFRIESTPYYFRGPEPGRDIAARIARLLPGACLIVTLRDPVERYLSARTHHIMKGRLPYAPILDDLDERYGMCALGLYADILAHWRTKHEDMHVVLYDDIVADRLGVVTGIGAWLGRDLNLDAAQIDFRANDKRRKARRAAQRGVEWPEGRTLPRLSDGLRDRLRELYSPQIARLARMIDRDLTHWAARP